MAAPLGFKTFNTGDVLSAADTNGFLMQGVLVFADAAARSAAITSPQEGQTSYLKDTDVIQVYSGSAWVTKSGGSSPLTTKGDLYTYSTTDARLPVGTNGHTLVADSAEATGLKWAAPAGGGKVLQVVSTTKTDTFTSSTGNTFVDVTGLSASITPSSATSKILVMVKMSMGSNTGNGYVFYKIVRGATDICIGDSAGSRLRSTGGSSSPFTEVPFGDSAVFLDSPSTTSATTYKIQLYAQQGTGTAYVNRSYLDTDANYCPRTASTITLMEIGA
jgi:hypothetical protein